MKNHEYLGLDVGAMRTGIARANSAAGLAEPVVMVKTDEIFDKLEEITRRSNVAAIVVGLPRNLEGNDTNQTRWVRDWVDKAKKQISAPLYWQDEALTSVKAENLTHIAKNQDADALAAAIILQDWVDTPEGMRVVC